MSQKPGHRGDRSGWPASTAADERAAEVTGRPVAHFMTPGATQTRPGTPVTARAWGPELWPAAVRDNVKVWPPVFRERQLLAAIRTPLTRPQRIALVSNKDGVGKSTTARILQTIFSTTRDDACAVIDANVESEHGRYIEPESGPAGGLVERVGGSACIVSPAPGDSDYAGLIRLLAKAYPIVICDVGSSLADAATREILDNCDQIVVVATPAVDELYAASSCLDDLRDAGHANLVDDAICAINRIRPMPFSDLLNIDRHFSRRCREVVRIPWDIRVTCANATELDELRSTTRTAFFELAAAIARSFGDNIITT